MAIDTAEKRRSVSGVLLPSMIPGVTPNASKDLEWRAQSGWSYSGNSVSSGSLFFIRSTRLFGLIEK